MSWSSRHLLAGSGVFDKGWNKTLRDTGAASKYAYFVVLYRVGEKNSKPEIGEKYPDATSAEILKCTFTVP